MKRVGLLSGAAAAALLLTSCEIVEVQILSPANASVQSASTVTVEFNLRGGPGALTATCQLDEQVPVPCTSPHMFSNLAPGAHHVTVRGANPAGLSNAGRVRFVVKSDSLVPVKQVSGGFQHTCALLETGGVQCWGSGAGLGLPGYLEIETEPPAHFPAVNVGGPAKQLATGLGYSCALLATGAVRCWGRSNLGQLGYGNTSSIGYDEFPSSAGDVPLGDAAVQISGGFSHVCALLATGGVRCWGDSAWGTLGYGNWNNVGDDEFPSSVGDVDVGGRVVQVSAGNSHTCAVLATGAVSCWGHGGHGRLGYGNTNHVGDDELPASVGFVNLGQPAVEVAAGGEHTCALLADGRVRCWGAGTAGIGTPDASPAPGVYVDLGGRATHITAGGDHSCAILTTGKLRCWGVNYYTGYGYEVPLAPPSAYGDVPLGADVVQVSAGAFHTCAVLVNGRVRCWGVNSSGQSGYPGIDGLRDAASATDVLVAYGPAPASAQ